MSDTAVVIIAYSFGLMLLLGYAASLLIRHAQALRHQSPPPPIALHTTPDS